MRRHKYTLSEIKKAVEQYFEIDNIAIETNDRNILYKLAFLYHIAINDEHKLKDIAALVNKHHTTILYWNKQINNFKEVYPETKYEYEKIMQILIDKNKTNICLINSKLFNV